MLTKAELQRLRALREKKHREALGLFVIEGEKVVRELLAAGVEFAEIYATNAWENPTPENVGGVPPRRGLEVASTQTRGVRAPRLQQKPLRKLNVIRVTDDDMTRASHFPTPSSVLAVGKIHRAPLAPGALARGLTLALDGVQDAGNVGTLLRIADWFAFDRVLLSPDCADLFHQKVINASMGSFARVVVHTIDLAAAFAEATGSADADRVASDGGVAILGCDLEGDDVHALPPLRDAVVVIGSEGRGLSPAVAARLTRRITIPRFGGAESLNAAIAGAIVCDNLRRNSI